MRSELERKAAAFDFIMRHIPGVVLDRLLRTFIDSDKRGPFFDMPEEEAVLAIRDAAGSEA